MKKFALCVLVLFCWNSFTLFAQNIPQKSTIPGQALTLQTQESVNSATQNAPDDMRHCGTDEFMQQLLQDPAAKAVFLNQKAQAELKAAQKGVVPCTNPLIIPIAVHYGTPVTDANPQCLIDAALEQIAQLNLDYSSCNQNVSLLCDFAEDCPGYFDVPIEELMPEDGTCIQFCLADQNLPPGEDNIGGYGITVGDYIWTGGQGDTQNNWDGYANIFVGDYLGGGILGIAPLFGGSNPSGNGVFVIADVFGATGFNGCVSGTNIGTNGLYANGAVCTHELGHYFGLQHTFGDNLADTPPQTDPNFGCPVLNSNTCTSSAGPDFSGNFMDYGYDNCLYNFTADQTAVMQAGAAPQNVWATNSISCNINYSSCQSFCVACLFDFTVDTQCNADGTTFTMTVTITGGTGPFTITESSGTAPETYVGVPLGSYTFTVAAGNFPTVTVSDAGEGGCEENTNVDDACAPTCGITMNSVINPQVQCAGAEITFDVVLGTCLGGINDGTGSGDDFLIVYDIDLSNTPPTATEIYDELTGVLDMPDLLYFGETSNCSGTLGTTPGFTNLEGWEINDCAVVFEYGVYVVPFDIEGSSIDPSCPIEGPITATVHPAFTPVVIDVTDSCRPTATLFSVDGTVCATADTGGADCTGDIPYDFIAELGLPLNAPPPCDWSSFVGTLPCNNCLTCPNYVQTTVSTSDVCDGETVTICVEFDGVADLVLVNATGVANTGDTQICYDIIASNTDCNALAETNTPSALCALTNTPIAVGDAAWNTYPALMATVVDDGVGCGAIQIDLLAADGNTVCDTQSLTCTDNSTTLNADFSADYPDPAGCSTLTATATCSGCAECDVAAAVISTNDPTTICVDDDIDEPIDVTINDAGMGANSAWVITDANGIILALPAAPPFILDGAGTGTCLIWYVNWEDPSFAPMVGDDAAAAVGAACAILSNSISVTRESGCGTMLMAEISDPCSCTLGLDLDNDGINDIAQETITITDPAGAGQGWALTGNNGNLVDIDGATPTTATVTDNGDGTYTLVAYVVADGASAYTADFISASGETLQISGGPCTACPAPLEEVPTIGEWGLIILGLLMLIAAIVGIRQRQMAYGSL